jgi:hypothetical protein
VEVEVEVEGDGEDVYSRGKFKKCMSTRHNNTVSQMSILPGSQAHETSISLFVRFSQAAGSETVAYTAVFRVLLRDKNSISLAICTHEYV